MLLLPALRQFKGIAQNPIHAPARKDSFLDDNLAFGSLVKPSADLRIFAFVIFPHDVKIDIFSQAVGQRRADAGQQAHRTQIDILLKMSANGDQQSPQRHMIRHFGVADRSQQNRIKTTQLLKTIIGHHEAMLKIVLASIRKRIELNPKTESTGQILQNPYPLGHHLLADAIARNQRDLQLPHFIRFTHF